MNSHSTLLPPSDVRDEFERLARFVQPPQVAERVWNRLMTDADRRRLGGNLQEAWSDGGTVGMWIRLHDTSELQAIVELAERLGFITATKRDWLMRGNRDLAPDVMPPVWDRQHLELKLDGQIIRQIKRPNVACNILLILEAFHEQRWPRLIDDPLPRGRNPQRLHEAIRSLNNGLKRIRFNTDGSGAGCTWRRLTP